MSRLVAVSGLSHAFGTHAVLRDVSLEIDRGDIAVILGANGAGKTTLLRILGRLLDGYCGDVHYEDRPLRDWNGRDYAKRVAYVPQDIHVAFPFSAREVVMMGRYPHQGDLFASADDRDRVDEALARVDAGSLAERTYAELSGGEKRLVALASALAQQPELLLLDEPTAFLDLRHQLQLARVLDDLHRTGSLTIVVVTHDLDLASGMATSTLMLKDGRVRHALRRTGDDWTLPPDAIADVFDVDAGVEGGRVVLRYRT